MSSEDDGDGLPDAVVDEAERLTRLAREADRREASDRASGERVAEQREATERTSGERGEPRVAERTASREAPDDGEADVYRRARDELLAEYEYTARVREDGDGAVLVLHPDEWLEDGTAQIEHIEDVSRGVEVPLSGPGEGADWEAVEAHNRDIAETVAETHGEPHGATAHALADFAGNHYAKRLESLTPPELREFREEYLPRNAWPTQAQRDVVAKSLRLTLVAADAPIASEERR